MIRIRSIRSIATAMLACFLLGATQAHAGEPGYYRYPTIHGDQVVFVCEGDLWRANTNGTEATRLTSHPGLESAPRFSPDGKWIAFSGDYFSAGDVYLLPSDGGEPKRLTFHPSREEPVGWTPDGESVLFRSRRSGRDWEDYLLKISKDGGEPERVPVGVASLASYSADGKRIAFNPFGWNANWKRYHGGTAPTIWVGDADGKQFTNITAGDTSVNQFPMWVGDRIYFVSERKVTANLFSCKPDGSDVKQLTSHTDYDVRYPDTDGKRIVYMNGADLWVYDIASGSYNKLDIKLPSDRIRALARVEDASKTLEKYEISPDGKRVLVNSRGRIWNAPSKPEDRIIDLTPDPDVVRRRLPSWSPDGERIAYITDETGEQEIALVDAKGKGDPKVITDRKVGWLFEPLWSPDNKHIAYGEMTGTLVLLDAESGKAKEVDHDKNWEITSYDFSPDGKWLAYTKQGDNQLSSIWIYNIEQDKSYQATTGFSNDYAPAWSLDGKYLFFHSDRSFNPYLDTFDRNFIVQKTAKPCLIILAKDGKSPFLPDEVLGEDSSKDDKAKDKDKDKDAKEEKKDDDKDKDKDKDVATTTPASAPTTLASATSKPSAKKKDLPKVKVDVDEIQQRVVEFPVGPDNYQDTAAGDGKLWYRVVPVRGLAEGGRRDTATQETQLKYFDLKKKKEETFSPRITSFNLSRDGKRIAWRSGGGSSREINIADASGKAPGEIEEKVTLSSLPLEVEPEKEFMQMFNEAWRLQRDFFWAENMAGVDWPATKKKYEPLVCRAATRGELNDIIGQMQGELGNSHTYISGGDQPFGPPEPASVGSLGADVAIDKDTGLHKFIKVFRPEPWETDIDAPLTMTNVNVHEGDYLLAVNGRELKRGDSIDQRLTNQAGVQVQLTVCSKPDKSDKRDVQLETLKGDFKLRYADWCRRNREYVAKKSGGKLGYFHLPDMQGAGLVQFVKGFYPQVMKDGLIIDARDNHGGFVSQMMIEKLKRQVWAYDRPRRGRMGTYPDIVHQGYKAVLINEHAGSDGDIFPDSFRTNKLGVLIGKRTWGGVVGIRGDKRFIDGGSITEPEFAWWDPQRGWSIENQGVAPDIEVEYSPADYLADRDPQIDRAIDELMKKIADQPVMRPSPPPFPDRVHQPQQAADTGRGG